MLEIKHLTKIYKTKGGAETRALDDVSISFDKTGLVFLLGKSGSGKSTLLNLAGGLDEPTSGEIVVMGKSSKEFSGSDFDSYRNTFIGFVFQEYNVLNEFNVEDNIALALELQGKKKDREKIHALLQEVELEKFAKRKPNTLSGGQKQRIAIARALIKDPQIIMADEPTGALDSATGKQVFDTLKQLSKTRLVIVVSHDREFAEIYGDRIVELKDGKIISDVTKSHEQPKVLSETVTRIGEDTLSVKSGSLDKATLSTIEKFLSEGEGDILISRNGKDIASFKRANRIDDDNRREHFVDTPENAVKPYEGDKAKFIRSRLPAGKAVKIGASGLKLKPFRLLFTLLLSFVAFVMFGLFSTMMFYDGNAVLTESFMNSDYSYLSLTKRYEYTQTYFYLNSGEEDSYTSSADAYFTPDEVETLSSRYGSAVAGWNFNGSVSNVTTTNSGIYYQYKLDKAAIIPEGSALRERLIGNSQYPSAANEICVSSYLVESIRNATFRTVTADGKSGNEKTINSADDLIGEYLLVQGEPLKVTGVFESGTIPDKYEKLKSESGNYLDQMSYESYLEDAMHTLIFISEDFYEEYEGKLVYHYTYNNFNYFDWANQVQLMLDEENNNYAWMNGVKVYDPADTTQAEVQFLSGSARTLGDNEIVIGASNLGNLAPKQNPYENRDDWSSLDEETWNRLREEWWQNRENYLHACEVYAYHRVQELVGDDENGYYWEDHTATDEEIAEAWNFIKSYLADPANNCNLTRPVYIDNMNRGDYAIVGFYDDNKISSGLYCSQALYDMAGVYSTSKTETKYVAQEDEIFDFVLIPFEKTESAFRALLDTLGSEHKNPENDVFYRLENALYENVEMANELVGMLSQIFLWVGVGVALFAALLLFNFITMSISNKKKEIGILRAVGARGTDVFKIFFAESGIIVGICAILSLVGTFVLTGVLNTVLKTNAGLEVTLFVFGPLSVALMLGVALVVALISTFLPVFFAARKKPVESIRAL